MDTKQSRYEALFRDSSVWRSIFSLALPSLLTIVVMIFYNMADLFFIAQLRDTAKVAAVSIVMPVFSIIMALATMLGAGGSAILANAIGAGDTEKAKNTSSLCFWAAIGIGLAVGILLLMFQTPLLRMLGTKPEMWEDAKRYQSVLALGTAFMLLPSSMGMLIRSEGAVKEGLIGNLIKQKASVSGAECGCQAEIGSACSMAAGGLDYLYGLSTNQIQYAAEIALEHHLGLTCDPILGLVQVPCIERNAVAATRAMNACNLSFFLSDTQRISFDIAVRTMYETGVSMNKRFLETSEGGLAKMYGRRNTI